MAQRKFVAGAVILGAGLALAGCDKGANPFAGLTGGTDKAAPAAAAPAPGGERDVEAPNVFSAEGEGLWDGRPSLGGVWVAHPDVKDPERVIIRNAANGKSVIGALFRRERDNPGPKLQVSSDAAAALEMLAGAPTKISVVALRREEAPAPAAQTPPPAAAAIGGEKIDARPIGDIAATAGNAIAAAAAAAEAKPAAKPATTPAQPAADKPAAGATKPLVQIGIFSVEANANRAAEQMQKAGVSASVRKEESQGKTFWRLIAGPVASAAERDALIAKIKGLGYADAYAVSN